MSTPKNFFGEMKLTRPVSFRLPEPMYRKLVANLNGNRISDVLRDMVANSNEFETKIFKENEK